MQIACRAVAIDDRDAGVFVARLGKVNAPRQIGRLTPAAACRKTALPAKRLPKREARSKGVGDLPERQFVKVDGQDHGQKAADQPAMEHTARTQKVERQ